MYKLEGMWLFHCNSVFILIQSAPPNINNLLYSSNKVIIITIVLVIVLHFLSVTIAWQVFSLHIFLKILDYNLSKYNEVLM